MQRDPIRGVYEHVDLLLVKSGEKVTVDIPVTTTGDIAPGGLLDQQLITVSVESEATHIPTGVEVDINGLEIGAVVTAGDLKLPKGTSLVAEPETVVLQVINVPTSAEATETGESGEGASGEGGE